MGNSWAVLLTPLFLVGCLSGSRTPPADARRSTTEPSGAAIEQSNTHQLRVELSGKHVLVDGRELGGERLRDALTKRIHRATDVTLAATVDSDDDALREVLRALTEGKPSRLKIEMGDVQLELEMAPQTTTPGSGPAATLVAVLTPEGRGLWRVDNVSGSFEDLGSWTPGDAASEDQAHGRLARVCGDGCLVALAFSDTPIVPSLRAWQSVGKGISGRFSLSIPTQHSPPKSAPTQATTSRDGVASPEAQGATRVSGRLAPALIQAIVRAHFSRFRACYEAGLGRNPELRGRVLPRFVIGRDGTVSNVADGGSSMPDEEVRNCVLGTFYKLVFPPPTGGIVTVVYPIQLEPG